MFFPVESNEKGFKEEKYFFKLLDQAFNTKKKEAFAFQQFPFNSLNQTFRYEPDTLFFHKQLGLFIFEVKSVHINDIKEIRGTEWHCKGSSGPYTMNPQKQAENQMFFTKNIINERCMLHNLYHSYAFVVLPNISEEEWGKRDDLQKEYIKRPILKDDLLDSATLYEKVQSIANKLESKPLSSPKWLELLDYFMISQQAEEDASTDPLFSELHLLKFIPTNYEKELQVKLNQGIKLYILYEGDFPEKMIVSLSHFIDDFQLLIYENRESAIFSVNEKFIDGIIPESKLKKIEQAFPEFNVGQYEVIHTFHDKNLSVSAGAGTGKTHVMVDRILFLLMKEQISLEEIDMITFTNASTNEMKQRLEKRLLTLYRLTNKSKFLDYAEDVSHIGISTIHSFAKRVIQTLAHELGFGPDLGLRSFKYEKQQIIFDILNDYFADRSTKEFLDSKIQYYEFVTILLEMWEEMEKKGLSKDEVMQLDFGTTNENSALFQEIIIKVFLECENNLDKLKKEQQAISMGDLIRKLKAFTTRDNTLKQLASNKYLFIDEFQDSDDVQIEFIAKLHEILNYKIFVVGDIKQAIYRFRGADYRAFQALEKRLTESFKSFNLKHNYRTSGPLLDIFHQLFLNWGSSAKEDLIYSLDDRLMSNIKSNMKPWHIEQYKYKDMDAKNGNLIKRNLPDLKGDEKLAILVRTNNQARKIKELCNSLSIATVQNLDGQFYISEAVRNFYSLLLALQYPHQPMYVIEALKTPYFGYVLNDRNFIATQGNRERIQKYLNENVGQIFSEYAVLIRDYSPLTIIQRIMEEQNFNSRIDEYFERKNIEEVEKGIAIKSYKENIRHLLTIIEQQFSTTATTIPMISNWLEIQMKTNRTENEPIIETDAAKVVISTVHRAKGLQYHTVFLPITNKPYNSITPKYFVEDGIKIEKGNKRRFGWRIEDFGNNHYNDLDAVENDEARKEEIRLLYVALTRAEQKVIITLPDYNAENSWSALLKEGGILGGY